MSKDGHTVHCCRRCLHSYSSQELLDAHALDCHHVQRTKFPKDPRSRFTNIQKQLLAPFVVYADFELILHRVDEDEAMDTTQGVVGGDELTPTMQLCIQAGEQCGTRLLQASCLLQGRGCWGDVCMQAARGSGAVVSGVHCYSPTTASAYRGRIALLPYYHQLSHMQPATGRGQTKCMIIVTMWGFIGVLHIVCVISCTEYQSLI